MTRRYESRKNDGEILKVKEMFSTIQGEGPMAGVPAVFVRLAECNLECWFCDTDFAGGEDRALSSVLRELEELVGEIGSWRASCVDRPLIVLTGGEPMLQPIGAFVRSCIDGHGWRVQIETDGVLWTDLPESEHLTIVCSPKTHKIHPRTRNRIDAYKYIIRYRDEKDVSDGLPICNTQDLGKSTKPLAKPCRGKPVYVQPMDEDDDEVNRRNTQETVTRSMEYGHRLCIQQHKVVGLR